MLAAIALNESSDEFQEIKKTWQDKANKATIETLPAFLTELTENYQHDYGTICHATAIAAKAAARAVDASPQGGITGFQAGCIMWQFIREWNQGSNKTGMKLVDYDNFLYPQYGDKFDKVLDGDIWEGIQKEAVSKIAEADSNHTKYLLKSEQYKEDIASFIKKYPDYESNKAHYDPLGFGNGEQHAAERIKKESGFEFAPQPPYNFVDMDSPVYKHWKSIVDGVIPFGYRVSS